MEDKIEKWDQEQYSPRLNLIIKFFLIPALIIAILGSWFFTEASISTKIIMTIVLLVFGIIAYYWTVKWHKPIVKGTLRKLAKEK
ncbi:hypothetical protein CMI37_12365 [Candidatus Pacearchaeota archaeon]|nr:hypothetical protein [Candidatus Pacearchaeota archaeon]|tara:strand:- start:437 stop:691 length:255 start_codon:yes stop_codon:yes gene_type:complete